VWLGLSDVGLGFDAGRRCAIRVPGPIEGPRLDSMDSTTRDRSFEGTSKRRAILLFSEFHCMEKHPLKMMNRDDWVEEGRKD
jgi:hypothetical protein